MSLSSLNTWYKKLTQFSATAAILVATLLNANNIALADFIVAPVMNF